MSIIQNVHRIGNFTSSNAYKLMGKAQSKTEPFSKVAVTYIEERNMERILGISIDTESEAKPLQWGSMCERLVNEMLDTRYALQSQETILHPEFDFWADSTDIMIMNGADKVGVGEIKCPLTKKSWFKMVAGGSLRSLTDGFDHSGTAYRGHTEGDKLYYQNVSHCCCHGIDEGEFLVFIPYLRDLEGIREEAKYQGINWISYSTDDELPYILEDMGFKNLTKIPFRIPKDDIDALTEKMVEASSLLIPRRKPVTIHDTINGAPVQIHDAV